MYHVMDLKERYREDAQFKSMVDMLCAFMLQNKVQPYEVRDAAFIAEIMYREQVSIPLYRIHDENILSCAAGETSLEEKFFKGAHWTTEQTAKMKDRKDG